MPGVKDMSTEELIKPQYSFNKVMDEELLTEYIRRAFQGGGDYIDGSQETMIKIGEAKKEVLGKMDKEGSVSFNYVENVIKKLNGVIEYSEKGGNKDSLAELLFGKEPATSF